MAETSIEWTNRSWNFLSGCTILTAGCTNCYAMKMAARIERMNPGLDHYRGLTKPSKAGPVWTGKIGITEAKLTEPLRVKRPAKWFVNSMSDLFHEDVPDAIIDKAFAVMALCPHHTFQVLTKRSARMRDYLSRNDVSLLNNWAKSFDPGTFRMTQHEVEAYLSPLASTEHRALYKAEQVHAPLPNVWLGVSVEDQKRADERIPDLLATPAAVRWISAEPLVEELALSRICLVPQIKGSARAGIHINALTGRYCESGQPYIGDWDIDGPYPSASPALKLDWVVVGGESGRGARPMHPDWVRSIRDQCTDARVPFFFKQWGEFMPTVEHGVEVDLRKIGSDHVAANPTQIGTHMRYRRVGKGRAGRLLDGREHNGFPGAPVINEVENRCGNG